MRIAALAAPLLAAYLAPAGAAAKPYDITLRALVKQVRESSPLVDQARAELRGIVAKGEQARLAWVGQGSWTNDFSALPTCKNSEIQDGIICEVQVGDLYTANRLAPHFRGRIAWGLPLWSFGKIDAGMRALDAGRLAGDRLVDQARDDSVRLAKQVFWDHLLYRELEDVAADGLKRLDRARKKLDELLDEDDEDADERDAFRLTVKRADLVALIQSARRGRELSRTGVRLAMGLPREAEVRVVGKLEPMPAEAGQAAAFVDRVLAGNGDVQAARSQLRALEALVDLAQNRFWPNLLAVGGLGYRATLTNDECVPDIVDSTLRCEAPTSFVPFVGLRLDWSLNVASRMRELRGAEADALSARADLRALDFRVRMDAEGAWRKLDEARGLLSERDKAVRAARRWVVGATMDHEVGVGSPRELLEALAAHGGARAARLQTVHDLNVALADLSMLAGADLENLVGPEPSKPGEGGIP